MLGVVLGVWFPNVFQWVASLEVAHVNLPVAILIWLMIYPMMIQIDWSAIKDVGKKPKGLFFNLIYQLVGQAVYDGDVPAGYFFGCFLQVGWTHSRHKNTLPA